MPQRSFGTPIDSAITEWRDQQTDTIQWAENNPHRFLLINAPTGSGKTLIGGAIAEKGMPWRYLVATNYLQDQVARTFLDVPTVRGRRHFECPMLKPPGNSAQWGWCVEGDPCDHHMNSAPDRATMCDYYAQLDAGMDERAISNYHSALYVPSLLNDVSTLVCDEAHNIERTLISRMDVRLTHQYFDLFEPEADETAIREWAITTLRALPRQMGGKVARMRQQLLATGAYRNTWLQLWDANGVTLTPSWARAYASNLWAEVPRIILMSATLMGGSYAAELLGLPFGTFQYLDLPSTFPVENRPVYFLPTVWMKYTMQDSDKQRQIDRMDELIEMYVKKGTPFGLVHAVSNKLRDELLTRSRWRSIMTSDDGEHEVRVRKGLASVLVAANRTEGWDGVGDLCRFIILPKVPFPSHSDPLVMARREQDPRSYDYTTLTHVVQGVGRGVRHKEDTCDTWILDRAWEPLYHSRKSWLPDSFLSAYHPKVRLEN